MMSWDLEYPAKQLERGASGQLGRYEVTAGAEAHGLNGAESGVPEALQDPDLRSSQSALHPVCIPQTG